MSSTIRRISALLLVLLTAISCVIHNPKPADCEEMEVVVSQISEGASYDIMFTATNGDFYYINRGLEQGLELEQLQDQILNKKVNLHLAKTVVSTSNHIAQLAIDGEVIYTEFD